MPKKNEPKTEQDGMKMSVADEIKAWALLNIRDIFDFVMTANDDEIVERYGDEKTAVEIAEKYLEIGIKASWLEHGLSGWSMTYTQPVKGKDERRTKKAYFYTKTEVDSDGCDTV